MTLLLKNSLPAERNRGCVFAENFDSVEAFYKNDGTVAAGTPIFGLRTVTFDGASYLSYPIGNTVIRGSRAFSIIGMFTASSTAGTQFWIELALCGGVANTGIGIGISGGNWVVQIPAVAVLSVAAVTVGQRVQIGVTYNGGAGTIRTYANGIAGPTQNTTQAVTNVGFRVGNRLGFVDYAIGVCHFIRLFDQELSLEEVAAYANNTMWSVI
jgi:hypothetical protein